MDHLYINYSNEVGPMNEKTRGFLCVNIDERGNLISAKGIHPFFKAKVGADSFNTLSEFIIFDFEYPERRGQIPFGTIVSLVTRGGNYLAVDDQGNVSIQKKEEILKYQRHFAQWKILPSSEDEASEKVMSIHGVIL